MAFKKIKYNTGEEIFHIKVQESDGSNGGNWKVMKSDFLRTVDILKKKYGIKKKDSRDDRDLDWLP